MGTSVSVFGLLVDVRTEAVPQASGWMLMETLVYVKQPDGAVSSREDFGEYSCHESLKATRYTRRKISCVPTNRTAS